MQKKSRRSRARTANENDDKKRTRRSPGQCKGSWYIVVRGAQTPAVLRTWNKWGEDNKRLYTYVWYRRTRARVRMYLITLETREEQPKLPDTALDKVGDLLRQWTKWADRHLVCIGSRLVSHDALPAEEAEEVARELIEIWYCYL